MNEKETREILDNMSEQEFNDFIFFALKEVEKENQKLKTELKKKDKMIDEMAETLRYYNGMQQEQCFCIDICGEKECDMKNCKECIKQYFERKVENGNLRK